MVEDEVALKVVHTADWHLGKRFRSFPEADEDTLTRERLAVVERILRLAKHHRANAVLCAGDLFDGPQPARDWWAGLAEHLKHHGSDDCPVFLLPGNHDPLKDGSVYSAEHPFRRALPSFVHIVDTDDFTYELSEHAVLHAVPCRSQAGQDDPTNRLPFRAEGDQRIRIGMVHGQTFDVIGDRQANFPLGKTAAWERGFNYLAIGDTHSFRLVDTGTPVPVVYPGAPEPTNFGEDEAGNVALVLFRKPPREPIIRKESVGRFQWVMAACENIEQLRRLKARSELDRTVLKLVLDLAVTLEEETELEQIVDAFKGTRATRLVAALVLDRKRVDVSTGDFDELLAQLPSVLQTTVKTLQAQAANDGDGAQTAVRALRHLYQLVRKKVAR